MGEKNTTTGTKSQCSGARSKLKSIKGRIWRRCIGGVPRDVLPWQMHLVDVVRLEEWIANVFSFQRAKPVV